MERIERLRNDALDTRPIYQKIWKPSATDKIAQRPSEWGGKNENCEHI